MIVSKAFEKQAVGILGLARSGLSAARALIEGGARVFGWDDGEAARKENVPGMTVTPLRISSTRMPVALGLRMTSIVSCGIRLPNWAAGISSNTRYAVPR